MFGGYVTTSSFSATIRLIRGDSPFREFQTAAWSQFPAVQTAA